MMKGDGIASYTLARTMYVYKCVLHIVLLHWGCCMLYIYVCVYVCMCVHIHVCVRSSFSMYNVLYMDICVLEAHPGSHTHMCVCVCVWNVHMCMYGEVYVCV